jgi:protein PsiE
MGRAHAQPAPDWGTDAATCLVGYMGGHSAPEPHHKKEHMAAWAIQKCTNEPTFQEHSDPPFRIAGIRILDSPNNTSYRSARVRSGYAGKERYKQAPSLCQTTVIYSRRPFCTGEREGMATILDVIVTRRIHINRMINPAQMTERVRIYFDRFLNIAELIGLILIGLATAFAMVQETWKVLLSGHVTLTDLLLMFLYLEVLAMDARYLRLGQLPVRFPLYIAMASLARDLILRFGDASEMHMLATTFGIVMLAAGIFILRYGQHRYPASDDEAREELSKRKAQ